MEQRLTSDIVRLCRERHFKLGTQQPPHFNALACFQARAIMLQFPEKFDSEIADNDYVEMLEMCVHHLTRKNCPAQETIQLQINGHAEVCRELNGLAFEVEQRKQVLEKIMQEIVQIKVLDMRETYTTVLALHSRILDYVIESSRHLEQVLLLDTVSEVEIRVALGSAFPQAGLLYWIDLPEIEKKLQVKELADIIPGIRVHNKLMEKGGSSLQLPFEVFKAEIEPLGKRVMEEMQKVNEKAKFCTQAIKSHIDALGMHHVLIQRLRDELAFNLQAFAILETLQFVLNDKLSLVTDIHDKCSEHLKAVCDMIGSRKCVPNELVFPEFQAVGKLQRLISEEVKILKSYSRASMLLLSNVSHPSFQCTPTGLANLSTPGGLAKLDVLIMYTTFLTMELYTVDWLENDHLMSAMNIARTTSAVSNTKILQNEKAEHALLKGVEVELAGYCPVTLARDRGLLLHGNPQIGLVQFRGLFYSFSDENALNQFAETPDTFLTAAENVVRKMPQLVQILSLHHKSTFSSLSIAKVLEVVSESFPCDFGTQTFVHAAEQHRLGQETFAKRMPELTNKEINKNQTLTSYFRRESCSQVWLLKEKNTQTPYNKGTKVARWGRHMQGLRGAPTCRFEMLEIKFEV